MKKNFDCIILTIIGSFSVLYGLSSIFIKSIIIEGLILFGIGSICISLAIERFFKFENIEKGLNELKNRIEIIVPSEVIDGKNNIYEAAIEIINDTEKTIRATSFSKQESIPENYIKAVANRLKECKDKGNPIEYRVVISSPWKDRRSKFFNQAGVSQYFKPRYVDISCGLDILIVDNKHLLIAFPELSADESLRKGILFKSNPKLVDSIREWYDSYLWQNAKEIKQDKINKE